jgi:hypothetical protein
MAGEDPMATYLSNELAGTTDGLTIVNTVVGFRQKGTVTGGRVKRYRASITLKGQLPGDLIQLCTLPVGSTFMLGIITSSVSLGSSTLGIGTVGASTKYRGQSAGLTAVETPNLFNASAVAAADPSVAEEVVYATIGGAALPGSGTLVIEILVSLPN